MVEQIAANKRRSALLVVAFVLFMVGVGALIGWVAGSWLIGLLVGAALAATKMLLALWKADAILLAVGRAVPADPQQYGRLHNVVDGLCLAHGLPKPQVYVVHDVAPNSFAVGLSPKRASLAVTTGLLDTMSRVELEGVIAHELSHIRNYDILTGTLGAVVIGAPALFGECLTRLSLRNGGRARREGDPDDSSNPLAWLGYAYLLPAPLCGRLMRLLLPPDREGHADIAAGLMTRYPPGLIAALERLEGATTVTKSSTGATAHLWLAQPMSGVGDGGRLGGVHRWFATHPPLDERIAVLREL